MGSELCINQRVFGTQRI